MSIFEEKLDDSENLSDIDNKLRRESKIISVRSDFTDEEDDPSASDNSECELSEDEWNFKSKKSRKRKIINIQPVQTLKKKLAEKTKTLRKSIKSSTQTVVIDDDKSIEKKDPVIQSEEKQINKIVKESADKLTKVNVKTEEREVKPNKIDIDSKLKVKEEISNVKNINNTAKEIGNENTETKLVEGTNKIKVDKSSEREPVLITYSASFNSSSVSPLLLNQSPRVNSASQFTNCLPVSCSNSTPEITANRTNSPLVPGIYFNPNVTSPVFQHNLVSDPAVPSVSPQQNFIHDPQVNVNLSNTNSLTSINTNGIIAGQTLQANPQSTPNRSFPSSNDSSRTLPSVNQTNYSPNLPSQFKSSPVNRMRTPNQITPTSVPRRSRIVNSTPKTIIRPRKLFTEQRSPSVTTPVRNNIRSPRNAAFSRTPVQSPSYSSPQIKRRTPIVLNNISPRGQNLYRGNNSVTITPRKKSPERAPVQRKLFKNEVEGTIAVRSEDGFLRYVVNLANGSHIKLSNMQVQKLREQNNGTLPTKLRIPVPSDVADKIEPSFLIVD